MATFLDNNTWGGYAPPTPFPDMAPHLAFEKVVGRKLPMVSFFQNWSILLPQAVQTPAASDYELEICWQPLLNGGAPISMRDIVDHWWDDYITTYFQMLGRRKRNSVVRFMHEPNVGVYPWSANKGTACHSPQEYIDAFRHVANILEQLNLHPKVQLMWCVATSDKGGIPMEEYYPGSDYVGKLGVDIYNGHGAVKFWSARDLIVGWYRRLVALGDQPIWIAELGCREPSKVEVRGEVMPGESKAKWFEDLFALEEFPRITHTTFFNVERSNDWRVESSPESLEVVRKAMARRYPDPGLAR